MAWTEKRKAKDGTVRYRVRDTINGKAKTVVKDAGQWKELAEQRKLNYLKAKAGGYDFDLESIGVDRACELYLKIHGPSLKGGISDRHNSPYYNCKCRMVVIKRTWDGKVWDEITKYDVRDLLSQFSTVGTVMKYLRTLTHMFKAFASWNEEGNILQRKIKLPQGNPAYKWRLEMKPSQKKELPRRRILSPEEWNRFKVHLSKRARAICEIALRRFLRKADIEGISRSAIKGDFIDGLQAKTGERFSIPVLSSQPIKYDFTNFRKDFHSAQVAAGMDYPKEDSRHFTFRDLRRTGAMWGFKKTKDKRGVSKMLGHTSESTTDWYLSIDDADKKAIAAAVDEVANREDNFGVPVGNFPVNKIK